MLDHKLTFTGAAFYYDYRDKQLKGRAPDPIFVSLDALVQIPKSYVEGLELQIDARPIQGLTLSIGGTLIKTNYYIAVTSFGGTPWYFSGRIPMLAARRRPSAGSLTQRSWLGLCRNLGYL